MCPSMLLPQSSLPCPSPPRGPRNSRLMDDTDGADDLSHIPSFFYNNYNPILTVELSVVNPKFTLMRRSRISHEKMLGLSRR